MSGRGKAAAEPVIHVIIRADFLRLKDIKESFWKEKSRILHFSGQLNQQLPCYLFMIFGRIS